MMAYYGNCFLVIKVLNVNVWVLKHQNRCKVTKNFLLMPLKYA